MSYVGGVPAPHAGWSLAGMTGASWAFLAVAAVLAAGDWLAVSGVSPRLRRLEYACKPGVLIALLGVATTLATPDPARRAWFVVALVFCLAGDVLLMLPGERTWSFGAGLGAFLVAQACFIVGFTRAGGGLATAAVALAVLVAVAAVPAGLVIRAVLRSTHRWMAGPVVVYLTALLVMAATAWAAAFSAAPPGPVPMAAAGALLFVVSDTLLALDRFVRPIPRATLLVHCTYHAAVALLVLSLAGHMV